MKPYPSGFATSIFKIICIALSKYGGLWNYTENRQKKINLTLALCKMTTRLDAVTSKEDLNQVRWA